MGGAAGGRRRDSPLGVEDAEEGGASPVLPRQREDGPQVVEVDVALGQRALQPGLLEGGPLLLQGPSAAQVTLADRTGNSVKGDASASLVPRRGRRGRGGLNFTALDNHGF